MKKSLLILFFITAASSFAQTGFGVKGGLNYADNGEIEFTDLTGAGENVLQENADRRTGYHLGVFFRADIGPVYLKPELLYTRMESSYTYRNEDARFEINKLDLPILLGVDILGPVHVFAGPALQYFLNGEFRGVELEDLENFTIGAQFGVGVQLGRLGIDARYEQALSANQAQLLDSAAGGGVLGRVDSRPNQFILSLSLSL